MRLTEAMIENGTAVQCSERQDQREERLVGPARDDERDQDDVRDVEGGGSGADGDDERQDACVDSSRASHDRRGRSGRCGAERVDGAVVEEADRARAAARSG